ncbi:DNA transposase [Frankliniella fusca]|uniref:DNA transposase n=1 Tax=Frankliniella fusca TaxID=407009 RepID=A0AAE1GVL1_9NEOP|nr:DNA transposase [Frankliniella fusca]
MAAHLLSKHNLGEAESKKMVQDREANKKKRCVSLTPRQVSKGEDSQEVERRKQSVKQHNLQKFGQNPDAELSAQYILFYDAQCKVLKRKCLNAGTLALYTGCLQTFVYFLQCKGLEASQTSLFNRDVIEELLLITLDAACTAAAQYVKAIKKLLNTTVTDASLILSRNDVHVMLDKLRTGTLKERIFKAALPGHMHLAEKYDFEHRRVCALHFDEKMYFNKYKIILRVNAVPNTNLPDPLTAEVMSRFPVVMSSPVSLDENLGTGSQSRKEKRSATPATIETNSCKKAKPNAEECVDTSDFPVVTDDVPTFFVSSSEATAAPKTPIKRTTKASLGRQVGLQRKDRTPRKEALLKLCQEKHLEAQQVRRRLTYAVKIAKALSSRFKSSGDVESSVLQEIKISSAARDLLNWEKRNFGKEIRSRRWLLKEKCFVLAIYKRSPKTYRYLRQHFTLPSERTLNNILQEIKLEPGVSPVFLKIFEKKTFNWVQKDKVGVLAFDEVSADAHLSYNHLMDRIDGYEDFGSRGRTHLKANHVLVFRVRLLNSEIDYPVAFYPVNGTCPKETLAILIEDVIKRMQDIDIKILASVSDQGPTNRGAITILRAKCPQGECDSVYNVGGSHIVHLCDFPHLLKSLRNNLLTSDLNYDTGKIAPWRHIIEFFKLDEGICKLSKLKYAHLCPLGRNKMRVSLAAQIFSETNFKGMTTFHSLSAGKRLQDAMQTAELLLSVDRLFDAVNGPSRKDIPKPETRCRVTSESYHHTYWREMVKIMKKWFYTRKDTGEVHIPPMLKWLYRQPAWFGQDLEHH